MTMVHSLGFSFWMAFRISMPSMSGNFMSSRRMSYMPSRMASNPALPFFLKVTVCPFSDSTNSQASQITSSSSITSMLSIFIMRHPFRWVFSEDGELNRKTSAFGNFTEDVNISLMILDDPITNG